MPSVSNVLRSPRVRCAALDVGAVLLALVVGVVAFSLAAQGGLTVGPAQLVVSVAPAVKARTVVELPPFGSVEARTHRGPVRLNIRLHEIDVLGTVRLVERGELSIPPGGMGPRQASGLPGLPRLLWRLLGGGLLAASVAAALAALALRRRRRIVLVAVALAVVLPVVAIGVAAATWDVAAFREPTLRGSLIHAPQLVDVFSTRVAAIERLREQATDVATKLAAYYADDRSLASGGPLPGTFRVLHVTDLHLDAVGAELARSIASSYETSLVVDTGDLPILGARFETRAFASLVDTTVPYVYVPGNHDSPASLEELQRLGVTVLSSGTAEVEGLRIFPVPDPISRGFGVEPDGELVERIARTAFSQLDQAMRSGEETPELVAVHNPQMEEPFVGRVQVIVSGHTHKARMYVSEGTVRLNSGTLGGMPYDPEATNRRPLPYSASVLYYTAERPRRLIAIDRIAVYPQRTTTVTRDVIDESLLP